jgi:hypothetical protein
MKYLTAIGAANDNDLVVKAFHGIFATVECPTRGMSTIFFHSFVSFFLSLFYALILVI